MKIILTTHSQQQKVDMLVYGANAPQSTSKTSSKKISLPNTVKLWNSTLYQCIDKEIARLNFSASQGKILSLFVDDTITNYITIAGLGDAKENMTVAWRRAGVSIARKAKDLRAQCIAISLDNTSDNKRNLCALVEGLYLGDYSFDHYRTQDKTPKTLLKSVYIYVNKVSADLKKTISQAEYVGNSVCLTRDLVNLPSCDATPSDLAASAKKIGKYANMTCKIFNEADLKRMKMGGILSVAKGSRQKPNMISLTYSPKGKSNGHIVLVGKGVTFDAGGISIKPSNGMWDMKGDMGGGASVLGTMDAIAKLKPGVKVTGIVACAENMPDGNAFKPGDIIRAKNGKTIEIFSTDAEGRLLLADALCYASELKPDCIIDLATLTGGTLYATGELYSLIMSNSDTLQNKLMTLSKTMDDYLWPLPLVDEYRDGLTSGIADLKNSNAGSKAGTIVAGLFLQEFVDKSIDWAHLDIAGAAFADEKQALSIKGGTGAMVRTLIEFAMTFKT